MSLSSLYLDAFHTCARTGHFTRAAEELHITQSALSQRVAKLEEDLGTTLFIRATSGIQLTPAGEELLRYCQAKQALEASCLQRLKGTHPHQLTGVVRIGGFSSVMRSAVLPTITPLLKKNPQLKLQLITKELDELPAMLKRGEIDYMIHYKEWIKDDIETLKIGEEVNVLVEKKNYDGPEVYLDHDENDQTTARYLKQFKGRKTYERRYLDDVYGLIDGVKQGLGRAVLPLHLVKNDKTIKVINPNSNLIFPVILHYYRQAFYSELHKSLLEKLQKLKLS